MTKLSRIEKTLIIVTANAARFVCKWLAEGWRVTKLSRIEKTLIIVTAAYVAVELCASSIVAFLVFEVLCISLSGMLTIIKTFNDPKD